MNDFLSQYNAPYTPYGAPQYQYMGGYRNYASPYSYGQNGMSVQNQGMQTQMSAQQQAQSSNPWIQVPNYEGAKSVMVGPNQTVYMMSQSAPEFYVKMTDAMGVATLKAYRFSEFDPVQDAMKTQTVQAGDFVTRDEMNSFANTVSAELNALKQAAQIQQNVVSQTAQKKDGANQGAKGAAK